MKKLLLFLIPLLFSVFTINAQFSNPENDAAMHPYFFDKAPFPVVLVEMKEGFRVVGAIDCEIDRLCDGLPVEVDFEDVNDSFSMLLFRVIQ